MGTTILAEYRVCEQTRLAQAELKVLDRRTADERASIVVLETEWQRVAGPARIQALAEEKLGMTDRATLQLSALELLPRQGTESREAVVRQASAQIPAPIRNTAPLLLEVADRPGQ